MKLVHPTVMSQRQEAALRLCAASSRAQVPHDEIAAAVSGQLSSIEKGIRVIDRMFKVPECGSVDILAIDAQGRLVLVNVNELLEARALCRSIAQVEWMAKNKDVIEHFYSDLAIEDKARLMCFAGRISPEVEPVIRRLKETSVRIFRYDCLDLAGERWLVAQDIVEKQPATEPLRMNSVLTEDEIADFMGGAAPNAGFDEEVTSRQAL